MAGCKVSASSWKERGPSVLARQDCCPGYITELCSRFQSQPVVLWQPGICPVHNLPVLIFFSFALLLLSLCMCVCVSLSLFCVRLVPTFTASHTPTYFPSDDHRHRERGRERERERAFSLGGIEFCKTGINQINYFYSCGCVCVVCLWRENDSFRACSLLFFSFLSYFFFLKRKSLQHFHLLIQLSSSRGMFFFLLLLLFLFVFSSHHSASWIQ